MNRKKFGGFSTLEEFRRETGISPAEISDVEALKAINLDIQEQSKQRLKEANQKEARLRMEQDRQQRARNANYEALLREREDRRGNPFLFDHELWRERGRRMELEDLLEEQRARRHAARRRFSPSPEPRRKRSRKKSPAKKRSPKKKSMKKKSPKKKLAKKKSVKKKKKSAKKK
jgi:hypothetical protein